MSISTYTISLVNANLFYANFTNLTFQKIPIPHLTSTMKQKISLTCILHHVTDKLHLTCITRNLVNTIFFQNQKKR